MTTKITISDLQFTPARGDDDGGDGDDCRIPIGRVSFRLNGFMRFRNLPVHWNPDGGLRIGFPEPGILSLDGTVTSSSITPPIPDHVRRAIEQEVAIQIAEAVR